jgi:hypothetical protein
VITSSVFRINLGKRAIASWLAAIALACVSTQAFAFKLFTVGGDACSFTSIQDAINAATDSDGNSILVARNFTYSNQHLVISDRNINILGGLETCDGSVYGAPIQITGEAGHSVIEIEGNSQVYLSNLDISGADLDGSHKGGGIYFGGSGSLELAGVSVHDNRAGYGGGIDMSPSAASTLTLISSVISANTASGQGGGIRLEGPSTLNSDTNTFITGNVATGQDDIGFGGGIEMVGPAVANINSNLNNNTATYGGGIAALASGSSNTQVNLYTTSANVTALYGNHATATGGGIYLKSSNTGATASFCANNFVVDANTATNGAAIYADEDSGHGSAVYLNSSLCLPPSGSVACTTGPLCNEIADNIASDAGSATVLIQSNGSLFANRFAARRNQAGRLMELIADTAIGSMVLDECLLTDNSLTSNLLWGAGAASDTVLFLHNCTVSHNGLGSTDPVIYADVTRLEITDSIIDQPSQVQTYAFTGIADNLFTQYVLTNNTSAFGAGIGIMQGTPVFVDATNGDYHQQRTSPGVDVAPAVDGVDLDGNPRTVDLLDITNLFGPADLGAYEIQTQLPPSACTVSDTIFCNGFELED